jgi:AcrR family transcriptional regulator
MVSPWRVLMLGARPGELIESTLLTSLSDPNEIGDRVGRRSRAESKRATREALLRAGLAELVEHGLDTPSLDAICARAGFTRGAFYVHFKDRDDFLVAVTDWVLSSVVDTLVGVEGETDLGEVISRFVAYANRQDWPVVGAFPISTHRVFEAISRSEQLRRRFDGVVGEAVERLGKVVERPQRQDPQAGRHQHRLHGRRGVGDSLRDAGVSLKAGEVGRTADAPKAFLGLTSLSCACCTRRCGACRRGRGAADAPLRPGAVDAGRRGALQGRTRAASRRRRSKGLWYRSARFVGGGGDRDRDPVVRGQCRRTDARDPGPAGFPR